MIDQTVIPPDSAPTDLSTGYPVPASGWDEMVNADGVVRPYWQRFLKKLDRLGPAGIATHTEQARRSLAENGVTYNVYGDPRGMDRPWEFDPVPLIIPPAEWAGLEKAVIQRARLINALLTDLYGPQTLLKDGILPPGVVLGNPGYQFACQGITPPGGQWLHLYAVDLARGPDGKWWAFADRTQTPTGAGYALENRIVLSRCLPDEVRDLQIHRLAGFFRRFRENLMQSAPRVPAERSPNVVLLTPGPHNETYFEHAYISRYLGLPLVEAADLTVRDLRVWLKTLEGLQPVDVILRRVDDAFCDPLELRQDSFLGVPGLVEAARAGNVSIANPLGSGLAESAAMLAFYPALCRRLLGENLLLPNTATWWCGQKREREHVIANLPNLLLKQALQHRPEHPVFGSELDAKGRAEMIRKLRENPHQWVGQERIALSQAPSWHEGRLEPRPVALRVYLAAHGNGFTVMPGGLTRVSVSPNVPIVSMQSGGGSKDTWVLSPGPVKHDTLLAYRPPARRQEGHDLPSRVADHLFWLGRYAERAELLIRVMRSIVSRLTDEAEGADPDSLARLMRLLVPLEIILEPVSEPQLLEKFEREALAILFDPERPTGLCRGMQNLRRAAWTVRDRISLDTWRIVADLPHKPRDKDGTPDLNAALHLLNKLIRGLSAFSGMVTENMTRGHGWRFLDLGRRLERAVGLLLLCKGALTEDPDGTVLLDPLLEIADSSMTYRRRWFAQAETVPVMELLLREESNPRSAFYQLRQIRQHLTNLPPVPGRSRPGLKHQLLDELSTSLGTIDASAPPSDLSETLTRTVTTLWALSDRISHVYFTHAGSRTSRQTS